MARIKGGMNARKKHNRVLKLAKGYRGARSKQYRVAKQSVMRALTSAYAGRKQKKRQFRQLWIARINAAARINGLSYSKFMYGLKPAVCTANVRVNKMEEELEKAFLLFFLFIQGRSLRHDCSVRYTPTILSTLRFSRC